MQILSKIPLIDLKAQYQSLKEEINAHLLEVIEEASFVHGPKVKVFEDAFAQYHGLPHCIGVNSGTDALFLSLKALGLKPGDEVITVAYTFFATAEAVLQAGGRVKFVDVDANRFTLNPQQLEEAITPKTVGIIPVHLYGMPADMDPILEIARRHNLWVLEDACQAHGATYNLGAYGDGGAILTNDDELAKKLRMLRDHGQKSRYEFEMLGYNSRLDSLQAAVLSVKLPYLDLWNEKRRKVAEWYGEVLKGIPQVVTPKTFSDSVPVYHLYVILVENRDKLAEYLGSQGIATAIHYKTPLHWQTPFKNLRHTPLPFSESLSQKILSLPMYPELSKDQVEYIGEKIQSFYHQR
jgi:dTDP-4-amino-4,6-dideoxygalactose transaminase